MKKIVLLVSLLVAFTAHAQLEKKTWLMGGDASFYHQNQSRDGRTVGTTNTLLISPNIGYFFIDKLSGGLRASYYSKRFKEENYPAQKSSAISLGPFLRYYFLDAAKEVNLLGEVSYDHLFNFNYSQFNISKITISAGPVIFLNDIIGLEALVYYSRTLETDQDVFSNLGFKAGFQIHLSK